MKKYFLFFMVFVVVIFGLIFTGIAIYVAFLLSQNLVF